MSTPESVQLTIGTRTVTRFKEYEVDADMYQAAAAFSMDLSPLEDDIKGGEQCQLKVDGELVLTGLIDRPRRHYDKSGERFSVEGRDLMGLVVDSYCESFPTLEGRTLKSIAEQLLAKVPFISRKDITWLDGAASMVPDVSLLQVTPGQKIFDVLRAAGATRGVMFWCQNDGTFIFGKPTGKARRGPPAFSLTYANGRNGSNIIEAQKSEDCSQRYSKVTVLGQQQGFDDISAQDVNVLATAQDSTFPFFKPFVETMNEDKESPQRRARQVLEQQRFASRQISYVVGGHSQNGRLWAVDNLCTVRDDRLKLSETLLVYGRKFRLSKDGGAVTDVRLSWPGVVGQG